MVGEVLVDLLQPQLMSTIVDEGVLGLSSGGIGNMRLILVTGLQMIGLLAVGGSCGVLSGVFANLCGQSFGNDVRKDCFQKIMSLSFQQTDRFSTGSLITRVTNDVTQVQNFVMQAIRGFVRTFMLFGGGIICMVTLDLSFGAVIGCALPVVLLIILFFIRKVSPIFAALQQKLDRVNSVVQENVAGARTVKAYVREDYEKDRFGRANGELVDTQLHILTLFSYMIPLMNILMNLVTVAILYMGSVRIQSGSLTPGSIMAAITYVSQIMHSVIMLAMIFQSISRGSASAQRLREVLDCVPAIADGTAAIPNTPKGEIEFRNVSFSYPGGSGEKVLEHISLTIHPGETLGILGATGSGKSSLVGLIPRFYDVSEGAVLLDGVDVREYPLQQLRSRIAIALQKSELFNMSIADNIRWGREQAGQAEIEAAAETAQAASFIAHQPEGYETAVSEMGASLSGGQKQRVAISRAVLKEAPVMIFDDATSALDLKTEAQLYAALGKRSSRATKIIIAQRIASVKSADRIAVIDNGRIAACANHEELMKSCAIYQDIYNSQLKKGDEPNA
ncbi:MAG: ABC transporter ATP-binding protein [Provencibacterium sp.]|nr:ABC transporter ATP-binding protein [Provencibacterium sp.]